MTGRGVGTDAAAALREALGPEGLRTGGAAEYRLGNAEPAVVALPRDEEGVSRVLEVAWVSGLGVVPWGGGSHQTLGRRPSRYDVALDLRRLNGVLAYEPADMTATVQAGTRLADLRTRLGHAGQFWPLDPPLEDRATIGGVVAAGLGGPLRCRYGSVRDLVLGVRVAHADGTLTKAGARVVKNATAYNLTRLYTGSLGTLGILLEVTIRVQPRPAVEQGWWLTGGTMDGCQEAALRILGSHLAPTRVELLDRAAAVASGTSDGGPGLAVSFAGASASVREQGAAVAGLGAELGLAIADIATPERTWGAIRDFPWGAAERRGLEVAARWRGGVLPSECATGLGAVSHAAGRFGEVTAAATVSHGALRGTLRAPSAGRLADGLAAAREALAAMGGFLVVTDAPTSVEAAMDVWGPPPPEVDIIRRVKTAFDGRGILNPGRFVDGI